MRIRDNVMKRKVEKKFKKDIKTNKIQLAGINEVLAGTKASDQKLALQRRRANEKELLITRYNIETKEGRRIRQLENELESWKEVQAHKERMGQPIDDKHKTLVIRTKTELADLKEKRAKLFEIK